MASLAARHGGERPWRRGAALLGAAGLLVGAAAVWQLAQSPAPVPDAAPAGAAARNAALRVLAADVQPALGALRRGDVAAFADVCARLVGDADALERVFADPTPAIPDSPKPTRPVLARAAAASGRAGCAGGGAHHLEHAQWLLDQAQRLRGP